MRGRAIYFQNRRILVFCGYKRNTPRPIYDLFSTAAETATAGENNETLITDTNNFPESESGGAVGSDEEAFITSAEQQAEIESGISIAQTVKGTVYTDILALADNGIIINNNSEAIKTELKLSKTKSGTTSRENAETIKTPIPKFTESKETATTGENNDGFITSHFNEAEAESGISTRQNAEPYNEQPTPQTVIAAGIYAGNSGISAPVVFEIALPIRYMYGGDEANALSIEFDSNGGVVAWRDKSQEDGDYIGGVTPQGDLFLITDDAMIAVTADTEVTETEYMQFHKYFIPVPDNNA